MIFLVGMNVTGVSMSLLAYQLMSGKKLGDVWPAIWAMGIAVGAAVMGIGFLFNR